MNMLKNSRLEQRSHPGFVVRAANMTHKIGCMKFYKIGLCRAGYGAHTPFFRIQNHGFQDILYGSKIRLASLYYERGFLTHSLANMPST